MSDFWSFLNSFSFIPILIVTFDKPPSSPNREAVGAAEAANFLAIYFDHRWPKDLMNLDLIIYIDMPPGVGNIHTKFGPHPQAGLGVHSRQTDRHKQTQAQVRLTNLCIQYTVSMKAASSPRY